MHGNVLNRLYSEKSIYEVNNIRNKLYKDKKIGTTENTSTTENLPVQPKTQPPN